MSSYHHQSHLRAPSPTSICLLLMYTICLSHTYTQISSIHLQSEIMSVASPRAWGCVSDRYMLKMAMDRVGNYFHLLRLLKHFLTALRLEWLNYWFVPADLRLVTPIVKTLDYLVHAVALCFGYETVRQALLVPFSAKGYVGVSFSDCGAGLHVFDQLWSVILEVDTSRLCWQSFAYRFTLYTRQIE